MINMTGKGWYGQSQRHKLASKGVRTSEGLDEFSRMVLSDSGQREYSLHYKISIPLFSKEEIEKLVDEGEHDDIWDKANKEMRKFDGEHYYGDTVNLETGDLELILVTTIWAKDEKEVVKAGFNYSNVDEFVVYGDGQKAIYDCFERNEEVY